MHFSKLTHLKLKQKYRFQLFPTPSPLLEIHTIKLFLDLSHHQIYIHLGENRFFKNRVCIA